MEYSEILHALLVNAALLVVLAWVLAHVSRLQSRHQLRSKILLGVAFGLAIWAGMLIPLPWTEGIQFDGRNAIIGLAGAFAGPLSAAIAFGIAAAVRISIGGAGTLVGVGTLVLAALVGLGAYRWNRRSGRPFDFRILLLLGTLIYCSVIPLFLLLPDLSESDVVQIGIGMFTVFVPLTVIGGLILEDVRKEQRLERDLLRMSTGVDNSGIVLLTCDIDGTVTQANKAARTLMPDSVTKTTWHDLFAAEDAAHISQGVNALDNEVPLLIDVSLTTKAGLRQHSLVVSRAVDSHTNIPFLTFALVDISKRKELVEKLQLANEDLRLFASAAAHDLQEPLRKIRIFGERIQSMPGEARLETASDFLHRMAKAAEHGQYLVDALLELGRVSGREARFVPLDLDMVCRQAIDTLAEIIASTEATVEHTDLPVIKADPTQIQQLLTNLIGNALKYRRESVSPHVSISCSVVADQDDPTRVQGWEIIVKDNGIGFDDDQSESIFKSFTRLHDRSEYGGSGLGLSICRRVAQNHGGSIRATGEPGRGATFTVLIPADPSQNSR